MPTHEISAESEARWQAWLAKGRDRERRRNHRVKVFLIALVSGTALIASIALALV